MKLLKLTAIIILIFAVKPSFSQCSDAGICVLGKKKLAEYKDDYNKISIGYLFGTSGKETDLNGSLNDLLFNSAVMDIDLYVSPKARLNMSIPFTSIKGPLGTKSGIGDLTILYSHNFVIKKKHNLTISVGGKASLGEVNTTDSLPQRYMPGLGTNDLIVGATYSIHGYSVSVAYQKPFGRSANFVTRLKRGDDFLFRAGYFQQFNKVNIKAEILTIIKVQNSNILLRADSTGETFIDIEGTNEPQVNLLLAVGYNINDKFSLSGFAAIPFLKRNYNYDGLKRTLSAGFSVGYLFKL